MIFKPFVLVHLFLAPGARRQVVPVRNPGIFLGCFLGAVSAGVIDHEFALSSAELEVGKLVPNEVPQLDRERADCRGR